MSLFRRQSAADISDALGVTGLNWPVQKTILEVLHMQETDEQYRQRILVLVDGKDPVKLQAAAPDRLAKLLNGVSPARARKCPTPDKWSICRDRRAYGGYRGGFRLHPADQVASLAGNRGASRLSASNLPSPKQAKDHATDVKSTRDQNGMIATR